MTRTVKWPLPDSSEKTPLLGTNPITTPEVNYDTIQLLVKACNVHVIICDSLSLSTMEIQALSGASETRSGALVRRTVRVSLFSRTMSLMMGIDIVCWVLVGEVISQSVSSVEGWTAVLVLQCYWIQLVVLLTVSTFNHILMQLFTEIYTHWL